MKNNKFYCDNTEDEGMLQCGNQCDFCKKHQRRSFYCKDGRFFKKGCHTEILGEELKILKELIDEGVI